MQRRSIKITTLLILFSLFTIFIEFGAIYFIDNIFLVFGICAVLVIFFNHIALELSISYDANFIYNIATILESSICILFLFFKPNNPVLPFKSYYILLIAINWFFPVLYCIFRNLLDKGPRYINFTAFFRNMSVLFFVFYLAIGALKLFIQPWVLLNLELPANKLSYIPFYTIASHIEGYYYNTNGIKELLLYVSKYIIFFIPLGFYLNLLMKHTSIILRYLVVLFIAVLIEGAQYITGVGRCDIDDILLIIIAYVIGSILYKILNSIYYATKDYNFLEEPSPYGNFLQKYLH